MKWQGEWFHHPCLQSILNLSSVCPFVCHWKCYQVTDLNISAKLSWIFMKSSTYFYIELMIYVHTHSIQHKSTLHNFSKWNLIKLNRGKRPSFMQLISKCAVFFDIFYSRTWIIIHQPKIKLYAYFHQHHFIFERN